MNFSEEDLLKIFDENKYKRICVLGTTCTGKSTLIKLLLRLYDVQKGTIRLNGKDIKEYKKEEYHSLFATVFQDFKIFAATIADNVKMGCVQEKDYAGIEQALCQSGFKEKLKFGAKTPDFRLK